MFDLVRVVERSSYGPVERRAGMFLYVMVSADAIKIGISQDPEHRQKTIWSHYRTRANLYASLMIAYRSASDIEDIAHYLLDEYALGQEWFDVPPMTGAKVIVLASELYDQDWRVPPEYKPVRFLAALPPDLAARLDEWRARQPRFPSRGMAVRRLLDEALAARGLPSVVEPRTTAVSPASLERVDVSAGGSQRRQ